MGWTSYGEKDTENRESFAAISAPRAAALRRLRSETRLRAQCGRRVTLPMAARSSPKHTPKLAPDRAQRGRSPTPLRFRLTAKTAFVPLLLLFPANPLRWALPGITRDWAKRHRGRGRWTLRAHRTAFPGPHYGGRVSVRFCNISGAQKWSGLRDFFRATGPWVCKNCGGCDFTTAPEFTEPTLPVRFSS